MDGNFALEYMCDKCGHRESVLNGISWSGPFYNDVISDISAGKYGQKWKELFLNAPGAVIDEKMEIQVHALSGNKLRFPIRHTPMPLCLQRWNGRSVLVFS